jgi:hypothetical protein
MSVSLYDDVFGDERDPVLLLVNGLGSRCIDFKVAFCEKFADRGFDGAHASRADTGCGGRLVPAAP